MTTTHRSFAGQLSVVPPGSFGTYLGPVDERPRPQTSPSFPSEIVTALFCMTDVLATLASAAATFALMGPAVAVPVEALVPLWLLLVPLSLAIASRSRLYDLALLFQVNAQLRQLAAGAPQAIALTALVGWVAFGRLEVALVCGAIFYGMFAILVAGSRFVISRWIGYLARLGWIEHRVVVIGAGPHGAALIQAVTERHQPWTRIVGIFDDRSVSRLPRQVLGHPVRGTTEDLVHFAQHQRVDEIIIALPWSSSHRIQEIFSRVNAIPANIHIAPDLLLHKLPARKLVQFGGLLTVNVAEKPLSPWNCLVKRVEDVAIASIALLLLSPLLAFIALAVKLDSPGPVLFRQKRYGLKNELIEVFKFRTMHHAMADLAADRLTTRDDPRVTRLGRFLRRSSLDELPQLFNVLRGDMSVVGPRPHAEQAKAGGQLYASVVANYAVRHKIRPGITGWAQVNGWRGETDTVDKIIGRVNHDLYYIDHWSLLFDLYIVVVTPIVLLRTKNAY